MPDVRRYGQEPGHPLSEQKPVEHTSVGKVEIHKKTSVPVPFLNVQFNPDGVTGLEHRTHDPGRFPPLPYHVFNIAPAPPRLLVRPPVRTRLGRINTDQSHPLLPPVKNKDVAVGVGYRCDCGRTE